MVTKDYQILLTSKEADPEWVNHFPNLVRSDMTQKVFFKTGKHQCFHVFATDFSILIISFHLFLFSGVRF